MTNENIAESYMHKCRARLKALALKAMLRSVGVEPPKQHDVGALLVEHAGRFPVGVREALQRAAGISKELRKDRELAFYGDVDFIPTVEYTKVEGRKAHADAIWVFELARQAVPHRTP